MFGSGLCSQEGRGHWWQFDVLCTRLHQRRGCLGHQPIGTSPGAFNVQSSTRLNCKLQNMNQALISISQKNLFCLVVEALSIPSSVFK